MDYKQVIVVRADLKMPKGKIAAQVAHASVEAVLRARGHNVKQWREEGMAKIVLKVQSERELVELFQKAKDNDLHCSLITDAGRTVVAPGTKTCVGIGPEETDRIDAVTGELPLL